MLVLAVLAEEGEMHGYGLRKRLAGLLGGEPPESTVYDVLKRLERLGLVEARWALSSEGAMRRYYRLTPAGREALRGAVKMLRGALGWLLCR